MLGEVKVLALSSIWPWLVAQQAKARLGNVSVGTEENHWSQTANPRASPESTGRVSGVNITMISTAAVPGRTDQPGSCDSHASVEE